MGGKLTAAIKGVLRKSAKEVLKLTDDVKKTAKNADELKQIDEVIEHLEEVAEVQRKLGEFIIPHSCANPFARIIKSIASS